jgi:hypothetical protein
VTFRNSEFASFNREMEQCATDELGRYHVSSWVANPAPWTLTVESPGLAPYVRSHIELRPDDPSVIEIHLQGR